MKMFKRKPKRRFNVKRTSNKFVPKYKHHFKVRTKVRQNSLSRFKTSFKFLIITGVLSVLLVFGGGKFYRILFSSGNFKIKNIYVNGLKSVDKQKFINSLSIKYDDNLIKTYFVNIKSKAIKDFRFIKSIAIDRLPPDTIKFEITERTPLAFIYKEGQLNLIDEDRVYFKIENSTFTLPVLETDSLRSTEDAVYLLNALKKKNFQLYFNVLKLYNNKDKVTLILRDNIKVFWGAPDKTGFDEKLKVFDDTMLRAKTDYKDIDYIDLKLSNEGRVVVKPTTLKPAPEKTKKPVKR
ncbi:MAG: hypothetical protein A2252_04420 [Elusimicrobia bacterium RIFOXYA2_FULL_39_19]|nr:MAG: hypothetical protein A2252_04420 [Elusimicrobia bacterium RIFOXYA2_FULL_39_19]